jgi:hypothetical protein
MKDPAASLDRVVDGEFAPVVGRACERLLALASRYLPVGGPVHAEVLRSERRRQSTIHVIGLRSPGGARRFYLKTLNPNGVPWSDLAERVRTEYALLEELSTRLARHSHLGVVTPVACFPEDLSFMTEEFSGEKLDHVLARSTRLVGVPRRDPAAELCEAAGEWLRRFQELTASTGPARHDLADLLAYCEERLRHVLAAGRGALEPYRARAIMRHLEHLGGEVAEAHLELTGRQNASGRTTCWRGTAASSCWTSPDIPKARGSMIS